MKYICFYLPQFHEIPENNEWWGKGFTEWSSTKKAQKLYSGHMQPKEPLNDNYYDLSRVETLEWQTKIAKEHGIYGFCFYHYWFNGKRLLETPSINLLKNKHIDIPFCLSWANEPWTRSWDGKIRDVIMPQEYGGEVEWREHFECIHEYFIDERYIKKDGKPLFVIYRPSGIDNCAKMLNYWTELAKGRGLDGIYYVETLTSFDNRFVEGFDASIEFEPMYTLKHHMNVPANIKRFKNKIGMQVAEFFNLRTNAFLDKVDYETIWKSIVGRKVRPRRNDHFLGSFVNWDNTARKKRKGLVVTGFSLDKLAKFNKIQIERAQEINSEFIFLNAWNEWAEGTYLEPDKENEFGYLEVLKDLTTID